MFDDKQNFLTSQKFISRNGSASIKTTFGAKLRVTPDEFRPKKCRVEGTKHIPFIEKMVPTKIKYDVYVPDLCVCIMWFIK